MGSLECNVADRAAIIAFDNPSSGLFIGAMAQALEQRLDWVADDNAVDTLILTGAQQDIFIRHFDLKELAAAANALAAQPGPADAEWHSSI